MVLIQEPCMKKGENEWQAKLLDGNSFISTAVVNDRPYVLATVGRMSSGMGVEAVRV
jgi:hypothetical protein